MSEAPQRIGLISDGFGNWALAHRDEVDTDVHYIRADLYFDLEARAEKAEAERDALRRALKDVIGMLDDPTGCEHVRDMRGATIIARAALKEADT